MLVPRERALLLESLRPPEGYRLDRAIGTSYTLDLVALLTAPLAFTFFDWHDEEGKATADPVALLEAVRRNASRIHLFCHAGGIRVPPDGNPLFAYLEPCIVEVRAPRGGVFHPKVWVLRFGGVEGEPVRYRVLVLTRNLTFDRSWDTVLVLDGELGSEEVERVRPLADFVAALPGLAVREAEAAEKAALLLARELRFVGLEPPNGFDELRFHPFGLEGVGGGWPFDFGDRRLAISPFLDRTFLRRFCAEGRRGILVSRPESLAEIPEEDLRAYEPRLVLAAEADPEDEVEDAEDAEDTRTPGEVLCGLHAKLYVIESGHHAHVFTGSANATDAAYERNVEFLVELVGGKWRQGIPALIESEEKGTLRELLEEWRRPEEEPDLEEEVARALDRILEQARAAVATADLRLDASTREDGAYALGLRGALPELERVASMACWPASLPQASSVAPARGEPELARFIVSFEALTAFVAFRLVAREGAVERCVRFAVRLPLAGVPRDREERILRSMLRDRETVLRLLYMLLQGDEISVRSLGGSAGGNGRDWTGVLLGGMPLFEAMVRAVERDPEALFPVQRLVEDLSRTEEGRSLLPEGFERIWPPLRDAWESLRR